MNMAEGIATARPGSPAFKGKKLPYLLAALWWLHNAGVTVILIWYVLKILLAIKPGPPPS